MSRFLVPILILGLASLASLQLAHSYKFVSCGYRLTDYLETSINLCPQSRDNCVIKRATDINYMTRFRSLFDFHKAQVKMTHGNWNTTLDACKLGVDCPSGSEQWQKFNMTVSVPKAVPVGRVNSRIELVVDGILQLFCVQFPSIIV